MNNTYSRIISESERAWSFQWARTLFALERRLGNEEKLCYLRKYSINMAASKASSTDATETNKEQEQEEQFVAGLMIIKRMDYTKAEQRRRVLAYWQVSSCHFRHLLGPIFDH